ncbi:MAG: hypothetical protein K6V97_03775 [Actinomycetia bacterium]|nr:hypothetical protein [Actinomycetes bacterium]
MPLYDLKGLTNPSLRQLNEGIGQPGQGPGWYQSIAVPGSGSQTFSTPGSFSLTVPSGVTRLQALLTGGGGGGGEGASWGLLAFATGATSTTANVTAGDTILVLYGDATDSTGGAISGRCTVGSVTATNFLAADNSAGKPYSLGILGFYAVANTTGSVMVSLSNLSGFQSAGTYAVLFVIDVGAGVTPSATGFGATALPSTSGSTVTVNFAAQAVSCINVVGENSYSYNAVSVTWSGQVSDDTTFGQPVGNVGNTFMAAAFYNAGQSGSAVWANTNTDSNQPYVYGTILLEGGGRGGGGGATVLTNLIPVTSGDTVSGTVGAGGTSGSSPTAGGNTTLTVGSTTYTGAGGGAASSSSYGSGGAVSTGTGILLSSAGQAGTSPAGGAAGSINGQLGGGAGATSSAAPGVGGGGWGSYNGGNGQVIIWW